MKLGSAMIVPLTLIFGFPVIFSEAFSPVAQQQQQQQHPNRSSSSSSKSRNPRHPNQNDAVQQAILASSPFSLQMVVGGDADNNGWDNDNFLTSLGRGNLASDALDNDPWPDFGQESSSSSQQQQQQQQQYHQQQQQPSNLYALQQQQYQYLCSNKCMTRFLSQV
jgi:flagellar motor protein MotB